MRFEKVSLESRQCTANQMAKQTCYLSLLVTPDHFPLSKSDLLTLPYATQLLVKYLQAQMWNTVGGSGTAPKIPYQCLSVLGVPHYFTKSVGHLQSPLSLRECAYTSADLSRSLVFNHSLLSACHSYRELSSFFSYELCIFSYSHNSIYPPHLSLLHLHAT